MKIVFSNNSSWSIYNFRRNLLSTLHNKGHEIIIIAPDGEYLEKLSNLGYRTSPLIIDNSSKSIYTNFKLFYDLYKKYKLIKPDIVLHNAIKPNIYGALVCRFLRIPVVNNISGIGTLFISNNLSSLLGKILYRVSQKKVQTIFFQNSNDLSFFTKNQLVKSIQCTLLPGSGVDLQRFKPKNVNREDKKIRFCFVGRLLGNKGIYEFIAAAKIIKSKYSKVEFFILGELYLQNPTAINQEELNDWISQKIVTYLGKTDFVEDEIYKYDCIVLPSYREGMSRVLLEASSMAIPAITSDVPGCINVIEHGKNGFICKVRDSNDLALQMEKFTNLSLEERYEMGKYGREKVEKEFDEKIVIEKYLNAIDQIEKHNI